MQKQLAELVCLTHDAMVHKPIGCDGKLLHLPLERRAGNLCGRAGLSLQRVHGAGLFVFLFWDIHAKRGDNN